MVPKISSHHQPGNIHRPSHRLKRWTLHRRSSLGKINRNPELAPWGIHHWLDITQEFPENPDVLLFTMGFTIQI